MSSFQKKLWMALVIASASLNSFAVAGNLGVEHPSVSLERVDPKGPSVSHEDLTVSPDWGKGSLIYIR